MTASGLGVIIQDDKWNVLLETKVWTATRGACSGSSIGVQVIKSFNNNRYRGHRWTIESSQSRSLRLPQRGSSSCFAIKAAKSGLIATISMYEDSEVSNEVTKGL